MLKLPIHNTNYGLQYVNDKPSHAVRKWLSETLASEDRYFLVFFRANFVFQNTLKDDSQTYCYPQILLAFKQ